MSNLKVSQGHKYLTVLDAGSSSTRIYVYRYGTDDDGEAIIPLELTLVHEEATPYGQPLHKQITQSQVRDYLKPLLSNARGKLFDYGARNVPIYLLATQGMRNLEIQNRQASIDILDFVHTAMEAEKHDNRTYAEQDQPDIFKLGHGPNVDQPNSPNVKHSDRTARIIEGRMEGLLAWVSFNFDVEPGKPTIGTFELGGASMQVAFAANGDNVKDLEPHVKDVCITDNRIVYTKSWSDYGVDSMWNRVLEKVSEGVEGDHFHPCLRENQNITIGGINYIGSNDTATKWDGCRGHMFSLINDIVPKADNELFYGVGKPIGATVKVLVPELFVNGSLSPIHHNHPQFIASSKKWCESSWPSSDPNDHVPGNAKYNIIRQRCATAAWIGSLLDDEKFYRGPNLRNNLYIPTSPEMEARASWTMGAAALIARTQNTGEPGLKGCKHHRNGLEVMGIFNGLTDSMEDTVVAPTVQPPFEGESYDEVFTTNIQLIKSSDIPSAKFRHSLSDNNFITAQFSLSFANFALFAVLLVVIGAGVYKRGLRRASPSIYLP